MAKYRIKVKNLGYFGYKYEVYVLSVDSGKYDVERKYNDFMNLRTILRRFYSGYIVPSLPRKAPNEFTKEVLDHYKIEIQKFLNELFSHPLFKNSEILAHFILEKNFNDYERAKNKICKENLPDSVPKCYTITGQAKVSFDTLLENRCGELNAELSNLRKNFRKYFLYIYRIKDLDKELIQSIDHTAEILAQLASIYENISECYINLDESGMVEIFATIGGTFERIGESCKELRKLYEDKVSYVLRSYKDELAAMKDMVLEWKQTQDQITRFDNQLQLKKREVIKKIPMNKWEIKENCLKPVVEKEFSFTDMLPTEYKFYEISKEIYGYYCNRLPEEFKAAWAKKEKDFRENFSTYFKESLNNFEQVN